MTATWSRPRSKHCVLAATWSRRCSVPRSAGERSWSPATRAAPRAVLPWSDDADRFAVYGVVRPLLDRRGLTRVQKLPLRGMLREYERLEPTRTCMSSAWS